MPYSASFELMGQFATVSWRYGAIFVLWGDPSGSPRSPNHAHRAILPIVSNSCRVTINISTTIVSGNARSHEPKVASAAPPNEQSGIGHEDA
jgi:hypothetical protein